MTRSAAGDAIGTVNTSHELTELQTLVTEVRAELGRLRQEVMQSEGRTFSCHSGQLLEANEQLLLAALRAQTDAEMATRELNEVSRSAERDALTQLPNRVLLLDRFSQAIAHSKRHRSRLALLFLDLNGFKQINDTFGHIAGDDVLKLVAQRLSSCLRKADTVSRHGGDEFLILLTEISQASDAGRVAGDIMTALRAPSRVAGHLINITASIGISIYPDDGEDAHALIEKADTAMYRAKKLGDFIFHGEEPVREIHMERRSLRASAMNPPAQHADPRTQELQTAAEKHRREAQLLSAAALALGDTANVTRALGKLLEQTLGNAPTNNGAAHSVRHPAEAIDTERSDIRSDATMTNEVREPMELTVLLKLIEALGGTVIESSTTDERYRQFVVTLPTTQRENIEMNHLDVMPTPCAQRPT